MSHLVEIETQVRDPAALSAACTRCGLAQPVADAHLLFTNKVQGLAVRLPGWRYPVVCDLTEGAVRYDNFQGHWGDQRELNRFLQTYAVEKSTRPQCPP